MAVLVVVMMLTLLAWVTIEDARPSSVEVEQKRFIADREYMELAEAFDWLRTVVPGSGLVAVSPSDTNTLFDALASGTILCSLVAKVQTLASERKLPVDAVGEPINFRLDAKAGSPEARDNIVAFLDTATQWVRARARRRNDKQMRGDKHTACAGWVLDRFLTQHTHTPVSCVLALLAPPSLQGLRAQLFTVDDLVLRKNDHAVVRSILGVSRFVFLRFGIAPPTFVQLELDIERESKETTVAPTVPACTPKDTNGGKTAAFLPYVSVADDALDHAVGVALNAHSLDLCVQRVSPGRYSIGSHSGSGSSPSRAFFVRLIRGVLLVRAEGGWSSFLEVAQRQHDGERQERVKHEMHSAASGTSAPTNAAAPATTTTETQKHEHVHGAASEGTAHTHSHTHSSAAGGK